MHTSILIDILPNGPVLIYIVIGSLVAIILLLISSTRTRDSFSADITRDVGIAIIVAITVGSIYELHLRTTFDLSTMLSIVNAAMETHVPRDVWEETQRSILQRTRIRQDLHIGLSLQRSGKLPTSQAEVVVETNYALDWLKDEREPVMVQQTIDRNIYDEKADLPRFELITVGGTSYTGKDLAKIVNSEGQADFNVTEYYKKRKPVRIASIRREIVNLPGSYHIVMAELTRGFYLSIGKLPQDIKAKVYIKTVNPDDRRNDTVTDKGLSTDFSGIVLPGQSIEIKFEIAHKRKDDDAKQVLP